MRDIGRRPERDLARLCPTDCGQSYYVELDTFGVIAWGSELTVDSDNHESDRHTVSGRIEAVEDDSVTLRVGDSVVLLEVSGDGRPDLIGVTVCLRPRGFEVWPTGI